MSNRRVTFEEIERVQNRIEECLKRYMTKTETEADLFKRHNIPHCFTDIIWKLMVEQNQEFFKEYYKRLALKEQIVEFNRLLSEYAVLTKQQGSLNDANNRLEMPARGGLMPHNAQTVSDRYIQTDVGCSYSQDMNKTDVGCSYSQDMNKTDVGCSYSQDMNTDVLRLAHHPMDVEMSAFHHSQSRYHPYAAAAAHNNSTPSPPDVCNPFLSSSSNMRRNSQYLNGGGAYSVPGERNSMDVYNSYLSQDMINFLERQNQETVELARRQQKFRFMNSGKGPSNRLE